MRSGCTQWIEKTKPKYFQYLREESTDSDEIVILCLNKLAAYFRKYFPFNSAFFLLNLKIMFQLYSPNFCWWAIYSRES